MPTADSSIVQIAYAKETLFGVIPTAGNHKLLRVTGETLEYAINKEASEEINATRSVGSRVPVSANASGGLNSEVSYLEYDELLEAALQSLFAAYGTNGVGATFTADFAAGTITASVAPVGTSAFTTLKKGQWFRVSAGANVNNGKFLRVSKTVAPTATVITLDPGTPASASLAVPTVSLSTSRLTNGATLSSYSIERQSSDISEYWAYSGMSVASFELALAANARSTFAFNFMGKQATRAAVTQLPGTATPSKTYEIHAGSTGPTCILWVDGAPMAGTFVNSLSFTYDNALREKNALCSVSPVGIGSGTIQASGSMEVYFADGTLFDKFIANQNIEITFSSMDADGNGYIVTLPVANLGKVTTNAGSKDTDMMVSVEFMALRDKANADAALRQVIFIDRVGAVAA